MARAGMAKWRQGRGGPSSFTEGGGDEVQRSLELLDRVLSEFDDLENGNVEERAPLAGPKQPLQQQPPAHAELPSPPSPPPPPPAAAPPPTCNNSVRVVGGGGSTPEDEEEDRSHQSEDDGYMSMNGRRVQQRPPPPSPKEEEEEEEEEEIPPPIPPLPVVAPRTPPLPPLSPVVAIITLPAAEDEEDFPPPPEEAERIISTLLPRVSPSGGSGRAKNNSKSGRGISCGWGSLGAPLNRHRRAEEMDSGGCLVTTATQTTLPQTRHLRPYGWNFQERTREQPSEPLRFLGKVPLPECRALLMAPLPPRTLPGTSERHRVVRRREEERIPFQLHPSEEESLKEGTLLGEEETFSDDSLEAVKPPPSPTFSASSTSPLGSEEGKRRSVAWEVSLEELDALAEEAEEEGGGEGEVLPGCTARLRSTRSRRSSSSDRSLASSEPRSAEGSWRRPRSLGHLSSNGEDELSGLEGGGEAAAEFDGEILVATKPPEVRSGCSKGTYVIRKRRSRAAIASNKDRDEESEWRRAIDCHVVHSSETSSPDSENRNPKTPVNQSPEKLVVRTPKQYNSRIPILENSRIPIPESSRIIIPEGSRIPVLESARILAMGGSSSPSKSIVYLSANSSKTTTPTEPQQAFVKITESCSSPTVSCDLTPAPSPLQRPNELPEFKKTCRPNIHNERTPERRNAAGKLPPAPPPRTVTAIHSGFSKSPELSPCAGEPTAKVVNLQISSEKTNSPIREPPKDSLHPQEASIVVTSQQDASSIVTILPDTSESIVNSETSKELPSPASVQKETTEKEVKQSPLPPIPLKLVLPQQPPAEARPIPRVLSMPAIAICSFLDGVEMKKDESTPSEVQVVVSEPKKDKEQLIEEGEKKMQVAMEKMEEEEKEVKKKELEEKERMEKEEEVEEKKAEEEKKKAEEEKKVEDEEKKKLEEEESKETLEGEELKVKKKEEEEEKGERDEREREVETKETLQQQHQLACSARKEDSWLDEEEDVEEVRFRVISQLPPLQRSSTMPAVEESSPRTIPIAPSASASSFPPLPPSPVDEYSEVYDTSFFMRKLPRIPPPDGPLPPSPPPDTPPPPPPHSMAFHRPVETSLKSRSMDGGFPRSQRRPTGGVRRAPEIPGERRTLPSELQYASGRRRRRDEGDRPLSPVPSPPPHAPAHMAPPPPPPLTASLPETPIFSPRKGADVPRRGHVYARRGEPNGEGANMRHPSGAMTAGPGSGVCSGYTLCGTVVSSTSSTASSSPFPGGLGPGRGWYPRHRHHAPPTAPSSSGHHHLHPAHNRPRPASTEHLDRLASGPAPTAWDLHGYGPARAVVGGGAGVGGLCPGTTAGARKPLTLPPNLTPKFFHRSPREALRRVTSLLIRKGSGNKEASGRRDGVTCVAMTSPTAPGPSSPPAASSSGESPPEGNRGKRGFFRSLWKRSRHYSLEHQ